MLMYYVVEDAAAFARMTWLRFSVLIPYGFLVRRVYLFMLLLDRTRVK